jgi:hypothetical protein
VFSVRSIFALARESAPWSVGRAAFGPGCRPTSSPRSCAVGLETPRRVSICDGTLFATPRADIP